MALERIVSNKHFSGNYTDEEILNLFSNDEDVKYGEVIIFNDRVNPTIYFLDEDGKLVSIQKIGIEDGSDLDTLMDEVRELAEEVRGLETTVISNKDELDNELAGLTLRLEILEENGSQGVSPETLELIEKNAADIENLRQNVESNNAKIFSLEAEVEENELVHSAGINILNDLINQLENRIALIEEGKIDVDLTEVNEKITNLEEGITTINSDIESININISEINSNIGGLSEKIASIEENVGNIDLSSIEESLATVSDDVNINKESINTINESLGNINERLNTIEETGIESINDKIELLEKKDIEILNSIQTLKNTDISNINKDISSLEKKDNEIEDRLTNLEGVDTDIKSRLKSLEDYTIVLNNKDNELTEQVISLQDETSIIKAKIDDLREEVNENELVHSAGLITLNQGLNDLKEAIKNIEGGDIVVDLTEVENRLDLVEGDVSDLKSRVKDIEDGEVDVDFTEIEDKISEIEGVVNTNSSNIITINNEIGTLQGSITDIEDEILNLMDVDNDLDERITVLEQVEPVDLTEIEGNISTLQTTVSTVSKVANNALNSANDSIKTINIDGDDYINISSVKNGNTSNIKVETKTVLIKDVTDTINGLATTLDIKDEINRIKSAIDGYSINGKYISTNPELNGNEINVSDEYLELKPEDSQNVLPMDSLSVALAKIEKKMDIALEIFTAALNELNDRIKNIENKKEENN